MEESEEEGEEDCEENEDMDMVGCELDQASSAVGSEKVPLAEQKPSNVQVLTKQMGELSLKGELKSKLIDILISATGPSLSVTELESIMKPSYKSLFSKYGNTNEHRQDIREVLNRVECLPNSLGQLVRYLQDIGRSDLIAKIQSNFGPADAGRCTGRV